MSAEISGASELNAVVGASEAAILDALPAHIAVLSASGRIVWVNQAWRDFADRNSLCRPDYLVGVNYLEVSASANGAERSTALAAAEGIRSVVDGRSDHFSLEYPCHSRDEQRWFHLSVRPLLNHQQGAVVVMHFNITEQRIAKDRLYESERRFRSLFDDMDLVAVMLDRDARITYCNDYILRLTGWTSAEVLNRDWFDLFISPEQRNELGEVFSDLLQGKPIAAHYTNDILTRKGQRRTIHWNNCWLRSGDGAIIGSASIGEDVTWKREEEERQRANEERYLRQRNALIALASQGESCDIDTTLHSINANLAATLEVARASIWRYTDDQSGLRLVDLFESATANHLSGMELQAKDYPTYFQSLSRSELIAADDAYLDLRTREFTENYLHPLGIGAMLDVPIRVGGTVAGVLCAEHVGGPRIWTSDEKTLVVAMANQVSLALEADARRIAQEAIALSEERFKMVARATADAVWDWDLRSGTLWWNDGLRTLFGFELEEVRSGIESWSDHIHPEDIERVVTGIHRVIDEGGTQWSDEYRFQRRHGGYACVIDRGYVLRDAQGNALRMVGGMTDVTEKRRHEERERLNEERMRATLEGALDCIITMDASGRIIEFNPAAERVFGYTRAQVLGRELSKVFFPPAQREAHERDFSRYLETGVSNLIGRRIEMQALRADGEQILVELAIIAIGSGSSTVCTAFLRDITELRRAAAEVEASEERFRELADNIDEVFWLADLAARKILYVSPAYARIWGRNPTAVYAAFAAWLESVHPNDKDRVREAARTRQVTGEYNEEYRIVRPDGSQRWIKDRAFPIRGKDGVVRRIGGVAQDITDRKRAEIALSHQNRALQMLSASNEALVRASSEDELLTEVCRIAVEIGGYRMAWVGYAQDDALRSIRPVAHAGIELDYLSGTPLSWDENSRWGNSVAARSIRSSQIVTVEDILGDAGLSAWHEASQNCGYRGAVGLPLLGDGRTFGALTLYTAEPLAAGANEVKLLHEMADNLALRITNLRSAEENTQLQEAVLRIAQGVSAGSGASFFELLMRSVVEATQADGGHIGLLTHDDPPQVRCKTVLQDGQITSDFSFPLSGSPAEQIVNSEICVFENAVRQKFPSSTYLERLRVEAYAGAPLRDSAGRTLGILAIFSRRSITRVALVKSALRIFAIRAASEMERQLADLNLKEQASLLDEAHDAIMVRGIDDRIRFWNKGAERLFGWTASEATGHLIEELLCPERFTLNDAVAGVMQDGVWGGDLELRCKDGRLLIVAAHWTLVHDDNGRPKSILCINTDITRRVAIEQQLQQSQRLEAVGQLTGGVAHDFNNLLTVILGNAEMLTERLGDSPRLQLLAGMIRDAAQRGADLTAQLLAFARRQKLEPRVINVNQLLTGMEGLLRSTLREDIELEIVTRLGLWPAVVDPTQLESAVLNLCINARDAMSRGGHLLLETANVTLDEESVHLTPDVKPGEYVMVAVTDTGQGISPDHLKRVFEPFFTTKEFGKGTGLGLSMVYGFVKQSQGHVSIYSEVGQGTTIKMFLPRSDGVGAPVRATLAHKEAVRGAEKILLAEDDDMVRQYAEDQLIDLGYQVVTARNGAEALALLESHLDIELLFTDVVMPGSMNGAALAEAARRVRPGLAVLFTSGYTDKAIQTRALGDKDLLLSKPYRRVDLAKKLREALETPR